MLNSVVDKLTGIQDSIQASNSNMLEAIKFLKRSPPRSTGSSVISSLTASTTGNHHQEAAVASEKTPSPTSSNDSKRVSFDTHAEAVAEDNVVEAVNDEVGMDEIISTIAEFEFGRDEGSADTGADSGYITLTS
jgi:hypothetical protein